MKGGSPLVNQGVGGLRRTNNQENLLTKQKKPQTKRLEPPLRDRILSTRSN